LYLQQAIVSRVDQNCIHESIKGMLLLGRYLIPPSSECLLSEKAKLKIYERVFFLYSCEIVSVTLREDNFSIRKCSAMGFCKKVCLPVRKGATEF